MKQVSLVKALKMKNALVGEINRAKEILTRENSRVSTSTSKVDRAAVYKEIKDKTFALTSLKAKIAEGNIGIYTVLAEMEEKKGFLTYLKGLNTRDGVEKTEGRFGGSATETLYDAYLKQHEVDAEIHACQKHIEELQDLADSYNAKTLIEVNA